jgi:hypothetical protein
VTGRSTFDQHVVLFVAYGARVAQLTPASWDRLRLRCAALNGPAFRSLVNRALLAARPHELWLPSRRTGLLNAIASVLRAVQTGIAFAFEVVIEFETADPRTLVSPRRRTQSTGKARTDELIDATFLIESALAPLQRTDPGVVTAVRAAGQALLRHDWLSPADFDAVYAFVEPEIPFASLEPPFGGTNA